MLRVLVAVVFLSIWCSRRACHWRRARLRRLRRERGSASAWASQRRLRGRRAGGRLLARVRALPVLRAPPRRRPPRLADSRPAVSQALAPITAPRSRSVVRPRRDPARSEAKRLRLVVRHDRVLSHRSRTMSRGLVSRYRSVPVLSSPPARPAHRHNHGTITTLSAASAPDAGALSAQGSQGGLHALQSGAGPEVPGRQGLVQGARRPRIAVLRMSSRPDVRSPAAQAGRAPIWSRSRRRAKTSPRWSRTWCRAR